MKLSKGLLDEKYIGNKIFNKSIEKVRDLIKDVFGINFELKNENYLKENYDEGKHTYKISFAFKDRVIVGAFSYEKTDNEDVLKEVLKIHEYENSKIKVEKISDDFQKTINRILYILEEKYELNFTPLDPIDVDKNILDVKESNESKTWTVTFKADFHESNYKATYNHSDDYIKIEEHKQHIIYLD